MQKTHIILIISATFGFILTIVGFVLGFKVFQDIINNEIINNVILQEHTERWDRFVELPFPLILNVYIFNVTNPEKVLQGEKPIVKELGPYVYKQYHKKKQIIINKNTVNYYQYTVHEFDSLASAPCTENDKVTVLNVPLICLLQVIEKENQFLHMPILNAAWPQVFNNATSIFHKITIKEYFFNGYKFCQANYLNPLGKLACKEIRKRAGMLKNLLIEDDGSIVFSLFGYKNNHNDGLYEIDRGLDNIKNIGQIIKINNQTHTNFWNGNDSDCNKIRGTDGSIYPPFSNASSNFYVYSSDICRSVQLFYKHEILYENINGLRYELPINVFNGTEDCFCIKQTRNLQGQAECLPEGFNDLFNCFNAPILVSNPHLLGVEDTYQNTTIGLNPNEGKHVTFLEIEPDTGIPLRGAIRGQINIIFRNISGIKAIENVTASVVPIVWIEECLNLPEKFINELHDNYFRILKITEGVKWSLIAIGISLLVGSIITLIYLLVCQQKQIYLNE